MGMSQMCTGAGDYFRTSKPHSEKLCSVSVPEPPSSVTILDSMGREVGERAGPYTPGTILTLTCVAVGGSQHTHCHSMLPHSSTRIPKTR